MIDHSPSALESWLVFDLGDRNHPTPFPWRSQAGFSSRWKQTLMNNY
jgi:hypothetical protein